MTLLEHHCITSATTADTDGRRGRPLASAVVAGGNSNALANGELVSLRLSQIQTIHRITDVVSRSGTLEDIYQEALQGIQQILGVRRAALLLYDAERIMRFSAWAGISAEYRSVVEGHSPWPPHETDPQPILVPDAWNEPMLHTWRELFQREGIHGLAFIPLRYQGRLLGKFMVYYDQPHSFDVAEVKLAETIANQVAFATERQRTEESLRQANDMLTQWVTQLQQRTREISLLNEMGDMLQVSLTIEEAYDVIARFTQALFDTPAGALYIHEPQYGLFEAAVTWGALPTAERIFTADACWALRRGRVYVVEDQRGGLPCRHISRAGARTYICAPLLAHNETLGVLHIEMQASAADGASPCGPDDAPRLEGACAKLAMTLADHAALALANLRLRESLRSQAIRDPLTGLFNRRYLEETLAREVRRAARRNATLGVIMFDIDHFKQFNDAYGHQAGDAILRAIGSYLQSHTRAEDIACRYGGEEFTLILPEAPLTILMQRADQICAGITQLQVEYFRQMIGSITLSAGIAIYPDHGLSGEAVLRAADTALYRAKADGRNSVAVA